MALRLLSLLHRMNREVSLEMERRIGPLGLTNLEGHMLTYLTMYGPCPVRKLVRVFGVKRSTLTGVLDRLEAEHYLRRELNPDDRRSFMIGLEAKGRETAAVLNDVLGEFEEQVLEQLGEEDLAALDAVSLAISKAAGSKRTPGVPG